jgi:hypothetical protein
MAEQKITETAQSIIERIERIARETGNLPSTVCQQAFKNPKVYDRLKRRLDYDASLISRLDDLEGALASRGVEAAE